MTNFERIKAMTVDEMAEIPPSYSHCSCVPFEFCEEQTTCQECGKKWLESEV